MFAKVIFISFGLSVTTMYLKFSKCAWRQIWQMIQICKVSKRRILRDSVDPSNRMNEFSGTSAFQIFFPGRGEAKRRDFPPVGQRKRVLHKRPVGGYVQIALAVCYVGDDIVCSRHCARHFSLRDRYETAEVTNAATRSYCCYAISEKPRLCFGILSTLFPPPFLN